MLVHNFFSFLPINVNADFRALRQSCNSYVKQHALAAKTRKLGAIEFNTDTRVIIRTPYRRRFRRFTTRRAGHVSAVVVSTLRISGPRKRERERDREGRSRRQMVHPFARRVCVQRDTYGSHRHARAPRVYYRSLHYACALYGGQERKCTMRS